MAQDEERTNSLRILGEEILLALETLVSKANQQLGPDSATTDVLAVDANPMVGIPSGRKSIALARSHARADVQRITREPFVARLDVVWPDEQSSRHETLYVTRGSAAGLVKAIGGARVVSYRASLGRIAELEPGECSEITINDQRLQVEVRQRVRLRPVHADDRWDAEDDSFEFVTWSAALDSIRAFLHQLEQELGPIDELDVIGDLLEDDSRRAQIRKALRRQIVDRMALRDQPILDRYQGEVFRMPVSRRLMLIGPPGTGKTTTLIKRLAQKRTSDGLTEEEEVHLDRVGLLSSIQEPSSWTMFSPTELLQLYLRDAFNREGVPVVASNLKTWNRQRLMLGKEVLGILRTAESGRFRLDESAQPLADRTSSAITALQEAFENYFNEEMFQRARESAEYLRSGDNDAVKRVLREHMASIEIGQGRSPRQLVGILDLSGLQPELDGVQRDIGSKLKRMANVLVRNHEGLLDDMAGELPTLLGVEGEADDSEEDDDVSDAVEPVGRTSSNKRVVCAKLLMAAIRSRSRSLALQRRGAGGRIGRVLKFLDGRLPSAEEMQALGTRVVTAGHLRTLSLFARGLVMRAPAWYGRFRRVKDVQARHYTVLVKNLIEQNRLSGDEVDVVILTMLRNTRLLLESNPRHLRGRSRHDWLEEIKGHYASQIFVDEASDFSAVQLACTMEISHPQLRSWFACGDLNQRITHEGIRSLDEIERLGNRSGIDVEVRAVKRAYRQSARLRELAFALVSKEVGGAGTMEDPGFEENEGVPPQVAEHCAGGDVAEWLGARIGEVESAAGRLPSIAVFVPDEEEIDVLVEELKGRLAKDNIPVVGFRDGRAIGDAAEVRVFDVRHVKGLEFEAVFYVGIDRLARDIPQLFDRYFFVGVTRAATYLGITCEDVLPEQIEGVRRQFGTGGWAA